MFSSLREFNVFIFCFFFSLVPVNTQFCPFKTAKFLCSSTMDLMCMLSSVERCSSQHCLQGLPKQLEMGNMLVFFLKEKKKKERGKQIQYIKQERETLFWKQNMVDIFLRITTVTKFGNFVLIKRKQNSKKKIIFNDYNNWEKKKED